MRAAHKFVEKECAKIGTARITNAVGISLDESKGSGFWGQVNVMRSRSQEVDPDLWAIVEVSDASGDLIVVSPREQSLALPHEFASVLPGRLPVSLGLGRGAMGRWSRGDWATADEQQENVLCRAAQENKR